MGNNGKGNPKNIGQNYEGRDITDPAGYTLDMQMASRIKELMNIPPADDMPSIMARAVFRNDRQRLAVVKLHKRHIKFNDMDNEAALRAWCASTIGLNGLGRFESAMASVGLWADGSYRIARGMPKSKDGKDGQVIRGSDFRGEDKEKVDNVQ